MCFLSSSGVLDPHRNMCAFLFAVEELVKELVQEFWPYMKSSSRLRLYSQYAFKKAFIVK